MQSKLATWSTENRERKFDRLLRLIADRNWLSEAVRIMVASSGAGSPGGDGADKVMMEPTWESHFHSASYGFRPARSVHHAIRTVSLQLQDGDERSTAGRWVIEGDLASYFDTVHHRLLLKGIRKRVADQRFLNLLWKFI